MQLKIIQMHVIRRVDGKDCGRQNRFCGWQCWLVRTRRFVMFPYAFCPFISIVHILPLYFALPFLLSIVVILLPVGNLYTIALELCHIIWLMFSTSLLKKFQPRTALLLFRGSLLISEVLRNSSPEQRNLPVFFSGSSPSSGNWPATANRRRATNRLQRRVPLIVYCLNWVPL